MASAGATKLKVRRMKASIIDMFYNISILHRYVRLLCCLCTRIRGKLEGAQQLELQSAGRLHKKHTSFCRLTQEIETFL